MANAGALKFAANDGCHPRRDWEKGEEEEGQCSVTGMMAKMFRKCQTEVCRQCSCEGMTEAIEGRYRGSFQSA